ncbi:ATP synthase F0 subunit 8 (mitochondrion) [Carlito syrichta]|uniref:ATP synthase complex subunit 8 n=1 Tax=Carlito syrichta TaxID=1868482 RepID=C4T947_CARSF|nr:ATP synthase F0 subunit 8 [Carlito syrichta]BAH69160.1 ATP synthase F0 subunit 8 [Carlito syrichta]
MPQLDTSTWFTTILAMTLTLFILFQLNISKLTYPFNLSLADIKLQTLNSPWELKWTKIYLPLSLPLQ